MSQSPNLALPYLAAAQAQKHVTVNEALRALDVLVHLTVQGFDALTPPVSPADGEVWALGGSPTGAWSGQGGKLACRQDGAWAFRTPRAGWRAVQGTTLRIHDGSGWVSPGVDELQNVGTLGINATADTTNRLALSSPESLFNHEGAGHQVKVNKAAAGDTASLLFQTGFSGRAEMGTMGSDAFSVKVSADGSSWADALLADGATGRVRLPGGLHLPDGTAASPALAFSADSDTGLYRAGADEIALATGGTQRWTVSAAAITSALPYRGMDGNASAPGLSFSADSDTGLYRVGADTLGVSAGGAERLRVTTAGAQLTGLLTGTAVTQSQTDTTAGRLLKTGDGGILGIPAQIGDAGVTDNTIAPGFWRYDTAAGSSGGPSGVTRGMLLHWRRTSGGGEVQLFVAENSNPTGLLFTRSRVTGAWSDWRLHYGQHNVVGTVAFSGPAVSGAVIEAASNANGIYTRFADGTQICWRTLTASASAGVTWTFPAAFASAPAVTGTAVATVLSCVCLDAAPGTTSVTVSARDKTDARRADTIHLRAEGRWA